MFILIFILLFLFIVILEYLLLSEIDDELFIIFLLNCGQILVLRLFEEDSLKLMVVLVGLDVLIKCDVVLNVDFNIFVYWYKNGQLIFELQIR